MIVFALIIAILSHDQVKCSELICNNQYRSGTIGCKTLNMFEENVSILSMSVKNLAKPGDFSYFEIPRESETEFVPIEICTQLSGLRTISIYGEKISEIPRFAYLGCDIVTHVSIMGTKVSQLFDDTFDQLISMSELNLSNNHLKILPASLLIHNTKLTHFYAKNNELQMIEIKFSEQLVLVDIRKNDCLDEIARNASEVEELNIKIEKHCKNLSLKDDDVSDSSATSDENLKLEQQQPRTSEAEVTQVSL